MSRQDARLKRARRSTASPNQVSVAPVILAIVFPAIIGAAIALAYYGYRYAVAASERSKASLMEGNQQLANLLSEQVQDRIDKTDGELFDGVEWDEPTAEPPARLDLPAAVESVALMDEGLHIRTLYPAPEPAKRRRELG